MAASVVQLRTRADQIKAEQAERLRQMVLTFPELPERAAGEILAAIDRSTAAQNGWTFVMMSPQDNAKVVSWLAANSSRPMVAMQLWATLFLHLRRDTGEVMQTRDELADAVGTTSDEVSRIMGELEGIGAVSRRRTKVAGMRGPGMVRYFMSPKVGTHLTGAARDKAQASAPPLLQLVAGTPKT
jgi:CRP-like cAMP-binding protein